MLFKEKRAEMAAAIDRALPNPVHDPMRFVIAMLTKCLDVISAELEREASRSKVFFEMRGVEIVGLVMFDGKRNNTKVTTLIASTGLVRLGGQPICLLHPEASRCLLDKFLSEIGGFLSRGS